MDIRRMALKDLVPADFNPRVALKPGDPEYESLKSSLEAFGLVDPLIWNKRSGRLVGGHQRLTVMLDLGWQAAEVSVVDLDDAHEKALNVGLNKISGRWDNAALQKLLLEISEADLVSLTGFQEHEMETLFGEKRTRAKASDDDISRPIITKPGDLWLVGRHRLMCGDACSADDVGRLMDGAKARLCVTDPPYNVDYADSVAGKANQSQTRETSRIENDKMSDEAFYHFLLDAFGTIYEALAPGSACYVFHADTEGANFRAAYKAAGFKLASCLVWAKNNIVFGRSDYHWRHEPILYGWRDDAPHRWYGGRKKNTLLCDVPGVTIRREADGDVICFSDGLHTVAVKTQKYEILDNAMEAMSSVIYHDKPAASDLHPTMKPVDLVAKLIKNSSRKGEIVADFFGGSGSTLCACEENGRTCYTMEKDPYYCDQIVRRYIETTARDDVYLVRDGKRTQYASVVI